MIWSSILCNAHYDFCEQIMGDRGTIEITLGKGLFYTEHAAKVSQGSLKESWWAGATVSEMAKQEGFPIYPETIPPNEGFLAREQRYAREWLIRRGYKTILNNDAWVEELTNFVSSVRDGKAVVCGLEHGIADARGVIYGNRAIDTGQRVFWPNTRS